ncbi:glucans biosynthesis glucosyltransferase MdoH [Pseudoxanthomonas wuyuanensis]|uniref:Glucans biosynthesis glucosyltransferase H n=1 Tax=Pseudoxanthomonas wuyuanensis TaxID=1073196 RepID=A0A286D806_9GAMM|nr:glucans biosynthesis glucosyltransferase MdoH [Pseudoxanthomonas wuyuanensis]KAF1720147.1 glucans biosynthesis glucosyltransferase MdoH [Pseudoxanthomonas wuyuanensis]SOD54790.1 membrane glycosyltransferase [Pseudoxanthomonas wuyuanensis]
MSPVERAATVPLEHSAPLLPAESPLPMPVQPLHAASAAKTPLPSSPQAMALRRACVFGGTAVLTLLAAYQIWWVLRGNGTSVLEGVLLVLFIALFGWIAFSFISAVAGFVLVVARGNGRLDVNSKGELPRLRSRTALLMPTYNEEPERLLAGLQAIYESVAATGQLAQFDFFVLSDTNRAPLLAAEERAFHALRERLGDTQRIFYRRRSDNSERKAGNIGEWVRRFGAAYPQMLILDADSLMSGATIVRLAAAMERHPDVALIQTLPVIVNGRTLFARMQQFANRVYGPVAAYGVAWWHGAESNYWGHNAIIRTAAFAAYAGLPELRGRKPFAGTVLSHDFVEAALLRRGGWALHMVPGLGGSYEEGPPSLTDMLVRDRRWCQGNLQHGGVVMAKGLHWISRVHLMIGIGHYFTAPMWGMLMLVGLAIPLHEAGLSPSSLRLEDFSPATYWRGGDPERFLWVFFFTMSVLLAPKVMGFLAMLTDRDTRRGCGGAIRSLASMLLETLLAALMAPVTMYVQSRGVAEVLSGKDSGWETQRRDDGSVPLSGLIRSYGGLSLFGALMAVTAYAVSPTLAAWMAPVTLGMMLSIPVTLLTSSQRAGQFLQRIGLLRIPEETAPPPVLARARELRAGLA